MVNSQSNCSPGAASAETQAVTWTWRCDGGGDHEDGGGGGGDHEDDDGGGGDHEDGGGGGGDHEDHEDHLSGGRSNQVCEHPPEYVAT